jgi:hypothetical protein
MVEARHPRSGAREAQKIFLSYATRDSNFASSLARTLADKGAKVFDPALALEQGDAWDEAVMSALRRANTLIVVVPEAEGEGKSALVELGMARVLGKRILVVTPDRHRLTVNPFPSDLSGSRMIDATERSFSDVADTLLALM